MKFNKERTIIRSSIEGLEMYEQSFKSGSLRKVTVFLSSVGESNGVWKKFPLDGFCWKETSVAESLEVIAMRIGPRCLVIDELTRHRNTDQVFIPVTAGILAVAGSSSITDPDNPDPDSLQVIPVAQGEGINIKAGTWHTLPFATLHDVLCLSIMRCEKQDTYHDLRDLPAAGWVAVPTWRDAE